MTARARGGKCVRRDDGPAAGFAHARSSARRAPSASPAKPVAVRDSQSRRVSWWSRTRALGEVIARTSFSVAYTAALPGSHRAGCRHDGVEDDADAEDAGHQHDDGPAGLAILGLEDGPFGVGELDGRRVSVIVLVVRMFH